MRWVLLLLLLGGGKGGKEWKIVQASGLGSLVRAHKTQN
jgi:hypothetical protein